MFSDACSSHQAFLALIDDDSHSAQLLTRTLLSHGAPEVRHFGDAREGQAWLEAVLADCSGQWPGLVIVDLKAHSGATHEFLSAVQPLALPRGVPLAAVVAATDRAGRERLHQAGASAVFFRHAEREAYRREAAGIVSFWARTLRLDAVGM